MASKRQWPTRPFQKDRHHGAEYIAAMLGIGGYLDDKGRVNHLCGLLPYCHKWDGKLPHYAAMGLDGYEQAELIEHLESMTDGM